jgi:hypothetical protein
LHGWLHKAAFPLVATARVGEPPRRANRGRGGAAALVTWFYRPDAVPTLIVSLVVLLGGSMVLFTRTRAARYTSIVGAVGVVGIVLAPFLRELLAPAGTEIGAPDVVAMVGAVAAIVTLVLVRRQIDIARRQLILAHREIKLVRSDLEYSREQSRLTSAQLAELSRRPKLTTLFADGTNVWVLPPIRGGYQLGVNLMVRNDGERTSRDAYLEVLVPWHVTQHDFSDSQIADSAMTEVVDGVPHRIFKAQIDEPIYRDVGRGVTPMTSTLIPDPTDFALLWRLRDDYGAYPRDQSWGRLEVRGVRTDATERALRYQPRWPENLHPWLATDRVSGDAFAYASFAPEASEQVAVIDEPLQRRIEELVWSMPGLGGTTPETGQIGVEFLLGDAIAPIAGARLVQPDELARERIYERGRHRCYVRADGAVEVRLPQDGDRVLYELLRTIAAAYAVAMTLHSELRTQPIAHGHVVYKFAGVTDAPIGLENEVWPNLRLSRDEFVEKITPLVMTFQRAAKKPPIESETRALVEHFWAPYVERLKPA